MDEQLSDVLKPDLTKPDTNKEKWFIDKLSEMLLKIFKFLIEVKRQGASF